MFPHRRPWGRHFPSSLAVNFSVLTERLTSLTADDDQHSLGSELRRYAVLPTLGDCPGRHAADSLPLFGRLPASDDELVPLHDTVCP